MPTTPKPAQRKSAAKAKRRERASPDAERKQRQSDLLDEALLETFPASDSVSIGRVNNRSQVDYDGKDRIRRPSCPRPSRSRTSRSATLHRLELRNAPRSGSNSPGPDDSADRQHSIEYERRILAKRSPELRSVVAAEAVKFGTQPPVRDDECGIRGPRSRDKG